METQWPLVIFTLFVCLTCGTLGGMSILALKGQGRNLQMTALITSAVSLVVGGIGAFLHLEHWERIFNGFGHITSGITQELIAPGDIIAQTHQTLKNLESLLKACGSDLSHVIKTLVFVSDIDQFDQFNETYKQYFPVDPPARSTMQVGKFNHGMAIEIEAVATVIDPE